MSEDAGPPHQSKLASPLVASTHKSSIIQFELTRSWGRVAGSWCYVATLSGRELPVALPSVYGGQPSPPQRTSALFNFQSTRYSFLALPEAKRYNQWCRLEPPTLQCILASHYCEVPRIPAFAYSGFLFCPAIPVRRSGQQSGAKE